MVALVNFGSLATVGGKTVTSGSASGFDTEALINDLVTAKSIPLKKAEDSITLKTDQASALSEYKLLLSKLQSSLDFLRNTPGVGKDSSNIFQYRTAFLTASDGSSATNYLGVSVQAGATVGSYDLKVNNLALAASNTSISFTSRTNALVTADGSGNTPKAGTFSLNGANITLEVGDTLDNIRTKINATTSVSGVKADIIKVADGDYKLKITATKTGEDNDYAVAGDMTVFDSMFTGTGSSSVAAENAEVLFNNLLIERQTNSFNDLIEGATFTLYQESTATIKVDVGADKEKAAGTIGQFIDAYNEVKRFIAVQQQRDETGKLLETAKLGENQLLNGFTSLAGSELTALVNSVESNFNSLASIGITFVDYAGDSENPPIKNLLQLDESKLGSSLDSDFDGVRRLFEFQMTSSAPDKLGIFSRTNDFDIGEFQLDIDYNRAAGDQVRVLYTDSSGNPQTINADITFSGQQVVQSKDVADSIFGAVESDDVFTGIADGEQFRITLTNIDGTTTDYDFTFQTTPGGAMEFNSLDTLATAIEAVTGISASIEDGRLEMYTDSPLGRLSFTNLGSTDFKGTIGLSDTKLPTATINGQAGTVLEGLTFVYAATGAAETIDVELSQGIADRLFNVVEDYTTKDTGLIDSEVVSLGNQKDKLNAEVDRLNTVIDAYRERLLEQFAALEQAISSVNTTLQLLDAQAKARENA